MTVGLSTTALFDDFGGYFFGNIRDNGNSIMATCYPLSRCNFDCQINDLE